MKAFLIPPAVLFLTALLLIVGSAARAQTRPDGKTIAHQGNGQGAPACSGCHGSSGEGQAAAGFPRLAGLNAHYLRQQLDDMAEGSRQSAVMKPIASALSEDQRKAVSTWYSKLPAPAPASSAAAPAPNVRGRQLARRGRWNKQVPGCVACHGPHGVGVGEHFPPLAGQPAKYIADQLRAWQDGQRHNDPLDLMRHVASALDKKDIEAVSAWFAVQPTTAHAPTSRGDTP